MTPDITEQLLWNGGCLIVGFTVGWVVRNALPAVSDQSSPGRRRFEEVWRPVLGVIILLLVAATIMQGYTATARLKDLAACNHDANQAFQQALALRADASRASNQAQRDLLSGLASGKPATPEQRQDAVRRYLDALSALDATQAANPLRVRDCGGE